MAMVQRVTARWDTMTTTMMATDDGDDKYDEVHGAADDEVDNDGDEDDYGNSRRQRQWLRRNG